MSSPPIITASPFDVRPGEVALNLKEALAAVERAAGVGAGLLALPEKWPTSFLSSYDGAVLKACEDALAEVHRSADRHNLTVVGSAPSGFESGKPFNQVHFLGAGGDRRPYNKRALFSVTGEGLQVARGTGIPKTLETPVGKVCAVICYDLRFPEITRHALYQGADLLVVPAQWAHPRTAIFELFSLARAAENQCWLLNCNRAGRASLQGGTRKAARVMDFPGTAMLVDPLGELKQRTDDGDFLVGELDLKWMEGVRKMVPCARDLKQAGLWPDK